jgi:hypothetical protein
MGPYGPNSSWARPRHSVGGVLASLFLAILAWPLLTAGVEGPGVDSAQASPEPVAAVPGPQLTREGDKLILTGSVAALFNTGSFSGPNRAEKTNRARLTPDGVTVSAGFDAIRTRLAELRAGSPSGLLVPKVQVASVDPEGTVLTGRSDNPALHAIDQVVPMVIPMTATPKLAYARETTPPTPFDLTMDKFGNKVSQRDIKCMADAIYFEARGESYRGQIAVGQVVMNRLHHPIYPKDICQVVYQNEQMRNACQFSFACDGIPETVNDQKAWKQADEIARGVIDGNLYLPEVGKSTHYHATYVYPDWAPRLKRVTKIGHHVFYQFKRAA